LHQYRAVYCLLFIGFAVLLVRRTKIWENSVRDRGTHHPTKMDFPHSQG
jgi:hypothetical protein